MKIDTLFTLFLASALVLSLAADPVFRTFGAAEAALGASIVACFLLALMRAALSGVDLSPRMLARHAALLAYLATAAASGIIGIGAGATPVQLLRSVTPYLLLGLAVPMVLSRGREPLDARLLIGAFVVAGAAQSLYMLYLYLSQGTDYASPLDILMRRITLVDPRTTIPLFFAAAVVPMALAGRAPSPAASLALVLIALPASLAAFLTLTRTHALTWGASLLFLLAAAASLLVSHRRKETRRRAVATILAIVALVLALVAVMALPPFRPLPGMLFLRTAIEADGATPADFDRQRFLSIMRARLGRTTVAAIDDGTLGRLPPPEWLRETLGRLVARTDYATAEAVIRDYAEASARSQGAEPQESERIFKGLQTLLLKGVVERFSGRQELGGNRLHDEWLPALGRFGEAAPFNQGFGIGAGIPFETARGEKRTYIHNFPVYLLLYQGAAGLLAYAALMATLLWRGGRAWLGSGDPVLLAALAILAAFQLNALFFAVHKLVPFNLAMVAVYLLIDQAARLGPSSVTPGRFAQDRRPPPKRSPTSRAIASAERPSP